MTTIHKVSLNVEPVYSDEYCRRMIIDYIVSVLPDAEVEGPPTITPGEYEQTVTVYFVSKAFDMAAYVVVEMPTNSCDKVLVDAGANDEIRDMVNKVIKVALYDVIG